MKKIKFSAYILPVIMMASAPAWTACNDDDNDNWSPGPAYDVVNQVVFSQSTVKLGELDQNQPASALITLERESAEGAISVPLEVDATGNWTVPATADFADGDLTTNITVTFNGSESSGTYPCHIAVEFGSYNSPYTQGNSSIDLTLLVINWLLISNQVSASIAGSSDYWPEQTVELWNDPDLGYYKVKKLFKDYDLMFTVSAPIRNDYIYTLERGDYFIPTNNGWHYLYPSGGVQAYDPFEWGSGYESLLMWTPAPSFDDSFPLYPASGGNIFMDSMSVYLGNYYCSTNIYFAKEAADDTGNCSAELYMYCEFYDDPDAEDALSSTYDYLTLYWTDK